MNHRKANNILKKVGYNEAHNHEGFERTRNGNLYYEGILVVPQNQVQSKLKAIYDKEGFGFGLNALWNIVKSKYVGITREMVRSFLKSQEAYQLTRPYTKSKNPVKRYQRENQAWSIDLIDMTRYAKIKDNKNYKYILSVLDLYTHRVWLRKLKRKTSLQVSKALEEIVRISGSPKIIISDNGGEFAIELNDIKFVTGMSHTPLPQIEQLNGQIRRLLSQYFARNRNLVWVDVLGNIQKSLTYYNTEVRDWDNENVTKEKKYKFKEGDNVRVKTSLFESSIREKIKQGDTKHVHIKWTPEVYTVFNVIGNRKMGGLPRYTLVDSDGDEVVDDDNNLFKFKENDLQKVVPINGKMTQAVGKKLNRI